MINSNPILFRCQINGLTYFILFWFWLIQTETVVHLPSLTKLDLLSSNLNNLLWTFKGLNRNLSTN